RAVATDDEVAIHVGDDPVARLPGGGAGYQMVFSGGLDGLRTVDVAPGTRRLVDDDVPAMLALIELTQPGPFRPRTIELGNYFGIFHGDQLMAMAGQRIRVPGYTEISAVCTHPDARRRGYAAAISAVVARAIINGGATPILHVAGHNDNAHRVYAALGFEVRCEPTFAAVQAPGSSSDG
ncbi:MAG TPA: GNAT family N-acetyltransferase, partial [Ilumatobacteraceae bacterium]